MRNSRILKNGNRSDRSLLRACAFALALGAALGAKATVVEWTGAHTSTNADWSLAKNWSTGAAPTGNDTAKISVAYGRLRMLTLTPPLDFTGSVYVNGETTDWDTLHPAQVILNVPDGAAWTVDGIGYVYATPNIASRIAPTFKGSIVIPRGRSFVAPTTLNAKVEFVGDGTLTLSSATQLRHVSGFTGTLVWAGDAELAPEDTEYLQGRTWRLADGATLKLEKRILTANPVQRIPDWNEAADSWKMAGFNFATSAKHNLDTSLPHATADGSLALVTDAAQIRSAAFVGQRLKWTDSWGVSFRWTPDMPTPSKFTDAGASQEMSGTFGLYFTTNTTCANGVRFVPVKNAAGFRIYEYGWYHFEWDRNFSKDESFNCPIQKEQLVPIDGINLQKPVDFTVTFQEGRLTVQMRQGEKYLATFRKFNEQYTLPIGADGYYLCFGASSDWWGGDSSIPWSTHTVSNFKGWYRSREAGRWVDEGRSFYPFTSENAIARQFWALSDGTVTNVTNAFEEDGSFKLEDYAKKTRTVLMTQHYVKNTTPCLVTYDLVGGQGTGAENTEYTKVGFLRSAFPIDNWQYSYDNLASGNIDTYSNPLMLKTYWYGYDSDSVDGCRMAYCCFRCGFRYWQPDEKVSESEGGKFNIPTMYRNVTQHSTLINDGSAGIYYQTYPTKWGGDNWPYNNGNLFGNASAHWLSNGTGGGNRGTWANGDGTRLVFEHYSSWGRVDTWLKNLKVKVLNDNQIAYLSGELAVAANATATLKADAQFASSATETAEIGGVTLAEGATLKIATDVSGSKIVVDRVTVSGTGAKIEAETATVLSGEVAYACDLPAKALAVTGGATFAGDTLTFVVPDVWRRLRCGTVTLLDASSLAVPANVRLVTDAGEDLTARAGIATTDGVVTANWTRGLMVIVK